MGKKLTQEFVENYFKERGCVLLSVYKNNRSKLKYLCPNGHLAEITFSSFQQGIGCAKCSDNDKSHSHEYVESCFKARGCVLLSVYVNSYSKLKYMCPNGHKAEITFNSFQKGKGCRYCLNKTEKIVLDFLQEYCEVDGNSVLSEAKFDWCKRQRHLPFDFLLDDEKILVELDGGQHFNHVPHWKNDLKSSQERDVYKMRCATRNGYRVIRIFQEDVFKNTIDWREQLEDAIVSNEEIVYISRDPELYKPMESILNAFGI